MSNRPFVLTAACAALTLSGVVSAEAEDLALVVGNENYLHAADISAADDAADATDALRDEGFTAVDGSDLSAEALHGAFARFYDDLAPAEHAVIVLLGHFAQAGGETWLLGTDAEDVSLGDVDRAGLALDTVLLAAAEKPGGAIVLLGTEDRRIVLGAGLTPGIAVPEVPEGVLLFRGDAADVAEFAADVVSARGLSAAQMVARKGDLTAEGDVSRRTPFRPVALPDLRPTDGGDREARRAERVFWFAVIAAGTREAYEGYLQRYPQGLFADAARRAIANLAPDPAELARQAEDGLNLSRDQRRQIQRDLAMLDFDPRGIDGLFGPGTRAAITGWQRQNGHDPSGFVTRDQMVQLSAQAARRAEELEIEAARRQAELDRLDRLYWAETGSGRDEAGLRAYLRRYPDGLFSEVAAARIEAIEAERRGNVDRLDREAWENARRIDKLELYQDYLDKYPRGAFAEEARRIIAERTGAAEAERLKAEKAEAALNLNPVIRSLVEQRLAALGLNPGPADGQFDENTRKAIRRYQQARQLPVTGYLTQQVLVRLLADSL
ncbi:MAG: peptidoglycan-binding protein [Rhodobacteraceae bacterium]|nr:peptidoglycan-binding protein [Paracoccaceae bacterium]